MAKEKMRWFQKLDSHGSEDEDQSLPVKITCIEGGDYNSVGGETEGDDRGLQSDARESTTNLNTTFGSIDSNGVSFFGNSEDQEVVAGYSQGTDGSTISLSKNKKLRRLCTRSILSILLLSAALIATGIKLRAKKTSNGNIDKQQGEVQAETPPIYKPSLAPTLPEIGDDLPNQVWLSQRMSSFIEVISSVTDKSFFTTETAHYRALYWLAEEDAADIDPLSDSPEELISRYVAALFFFATGGPNWTNPSNFLTKDSICEWNFGNLVGLVCEDGVLTQIQLIKNGLNGFLPSELNAFSNLKEMNIYYNSLKGTLPDLRDLTMLEKIDLDGNLLTGEVPESLFMLPSIEELLLLNNPGLTGTIPNVPTSSKLRKISFYNCGLSGPIPTSLGLLSNLSFLQFYNNDLTGSIPSSVTTLPNLEVLGFRRNKLTGTIPGFRSQTSLRTISLGENQLEGSLPVGWEGLLGLRNLNLQDNLLTGRVSEDIQALPMLEQVWLYGNRFEGTFPKFEDNEGSLLQLYANDNKFSGNIDDLIQAMPPSLLYLDVSKNPGIMGNIPPEITRLSSLSYFNVSFTSIDGTVPLELSNLDSLETFAIQATGISGTISRPFCDGISLEVFIADCGDNGSIDCLCCTECCTDNVFETICRPK